MELTPGKDKHLHISANSMENALELLNAYKKAIDVNIISSITDTKGTLLHVNRKFCEVSKYSEAELLGKNHRIINSGCHSAEFFLNLWETISSGEVWQGEIRNQAKDGSFYWVDTVILPIRDGQGKTLQFLSLRTVITEKKQAEEERREYTLKLQEMLNMTSHRVRRPLATCLGLMNLVDNVKTLSEEELKGVIGHLKTSAQELDNFTKELTEYMHQLKERYAFYMP